MIKCEVVEAKCHFSRVALLALCAALSISGCNCEDTAGRDQTSDSDAASAFFDAAAGTDIVERTWLANCQGRLPGEESIADGDAQIYELTLGPTGCPRTTYTHNGKLQYAAWEGDRWRVEQATQLEVTSDVLELAVDDHDQPHIVFDYGTRYGGNRQVRYALRRDGRWHTEMIRRYEQNLGHLELELDPSGSPAVVLTHREREDTPQYALYYYRTEAGWNSEIAFTDSRNIRQGRTLEYDRDQRPHMMVSATELSTIAHLERSQSSPGDAGAWSARPTPLDGSIDSYDRVYPFFVLDRYDRPHVIRCVQLVQDAGAAPMLAHFRHGEDGWEREVIMRQTDNLRCSRVRVDSAGKHLYVAYELSHRDSNSDLVTQVHFAHWDGDRWQDEVLDPSRFGAVFAMAVDARNGVLHLITDGTIGGDPDWDDITWVYRSVSME